MNYKTSEVGYIAGTPFVGATVDMYAGPGGYRGEFMAWDPVQQEESRGRSHENFPVWSGTVVTAGDVAFYGTMDRWFKAVDAKTGSCCGNSMPAPGSSANPSPIRASDGRQYVAILSGVGGWSGAIANAEIDPRVRNGALGFNGATQDLPTYTKGGSELLVFAIPKQAAVQARSRAVRSPRCARPSSMSMLVAASIGVLAFAGLGVLSILAANRILGLRLPSSSTSPSPRSSPVTLISHRK